MAEKGLVKSVSTIIALLAVLVLTGAVVSHVTAIRINDPVLSETISHVDFKDVSFKKFCQEKHCLKINVKAVVRLYPNLLVPRICHAKKDQKETCLSKSTSHKIEPLNSDFDVCCPTVRAFDNSESRINIHGVKRTIFKTNESQQLIPIGRCTGRGTCLKCDVKTRTMTILVIDFNTSNYPPVEFDQFQIPMYCSCF